MHCLDITGATLTLHEDVKREGAGLDGAAVQRALRLLAREELGHLAGALRPHRKDWDSAAVAPSWLHCSSLTLDTCTNLFMSHPRLSGLNIACALATLEGSWGGED